jgi:hypothetical protein
MDNEIKQNFEEKLRLIIKKLLVSLDSDYQAMLSKHAAKGLLRSGNTIKATMRLISRLFSRFYSEVLTHTETLNLKYFLSDESEIIQLAENAKETLKAGVIDKFQKSTEMAGNPTLYERLLPDVEKDLADSKAVFQNQLNAKIIDLKKSASKSMIEKVLWIFEFLVIALSIFISGMWFNNPQGNYEPVLVGLGLLISLIYLVIRHISKQ